MSAHQPVEAVFKAVDQISGPAEKMLSRIDRFAGGASRRLDAITKATDKISQGFKVAGAAAVAAGAAAGAGVMKVLDVGTTFEKTLVGAAAKFDPTLKRGTAGFERLKKAARDAGATTEFNATQGAAALKSLASAGLDVEQAIAALPSVVDLATASEIELDAAAEMATKTLGAFSLKVDDAAQLGKNLARVNDGMAYTAGKTSASMEGLFETIKEGAPVATTAGASFETFMAMAGKLADAGIEGSVAGTTLKNVFLGLAAPSAQAAKALKSLHVNTKDENGNLRDVVAIFSEIEKATAKMGTAKKAAVLEQIFGKIPIAGVAALLDGGIEKIEQLRKALEEADGATAKMAETMRDTVGGDLDRFSSSVEDVYLAIFELERGPIRDVTKAMTAWVDENKAFITHSIEQTVKAVGENLPEIVKWMERAAKAVTGFYALRFGIKAVTFALDGYQKAVKVAAFLTEGYRWVVKRLNRDLRDNTGQLELFGSQATKAQGGLAGLRAALNASALGSAINGVTSKLGKAGLYGAAFAVGAAFGTWLNVTFDLETKINDLITDLTGLNDHIEKLGGRRKTRGLDPGGDQEFADGTIMSAKGEILVKGTDWEGHLKKQREREQREANARSGLPTRIDTAPLVPPITSTTNATVRQYSETNSTTTSKAEVTIKDETGRAEITKKPADRRRVGLRLERSGKL